MSTNYECKYKKLSAVISADSHFYAAEKFAEFIDDQYKVFSSDKNASIIVNVKEQRKSLLDYEESFDFKVYARKEYTAIAIHL
jgi:hypothetical protein